VAPLHSCSAFNYIKFFLLIIEGPNSSSRNSVAK
jgi:hypothetical protein